MRERADDKVTADGDDEDFFGSPQHLPVLSSSESWHESDDPSSQSDQEEIAEDASVKDEIKSEDEDSQSDLELTHGSRKDKPSQSRLQHYKKRNLSRSALQAYKTLLKDMHVDPDLKTWNKQQNIILSTVGLVPWTGKENDNFFIALARKGKGNVGEIAQQIKSKSRLEVADYIEFLEERLQRHKFSEPSLLNVEIPAAVEVSQDMEEVLDGFAHTVALDEQAKALLEAEKEHGSSDFWILDKSKAEKVEELLGSGEESNENALPEAISPSAGFLDLKNWITLSENIFMNAGESRPQNNWRIIRQDQETPSLTADALGELYDLTVSLVIRMVEEACNTALSRLDKERRSVLPIVKKRDVHKALNTMGMRHNTFEYYVNLPRRLKLDVRKQKHEGKSRARVPYDEVERMLSKKPLTKAKAKSDSPDTSSDEDTENDEKLVVESGNGEEDLDDFESSEDVSETQSQDDQEELEEMPGNEEIKVHIDGSEYDDISDSEYHPIESEKALDEYNDFLDQQASQAEEVHLRQLLSCPATDDIDPIKNQDKGKMGEPPNVSEEARREIMLNNDVVDWRNDLLYQDEWETYGMKTRDVERDIAANRNKRRRLE